MFPSDTDFESKFTLENTAVPVPEDKPFHVILLGNWTGNNHNKLLPQRRIIEVDRDNFNHVMQSLGVRLQLSIQNENQDTLNLNFNHLDDFHPDQMFSELPIFSELREIRRQLLNPETFNLAASKIRSLSIADKKAPDMNQDAKIDAVSHDNESDLLNQILSGSESSLPVSKSAGKHTTELNSFIADIINPHLIKVDEKDQSELLNAVDSSISQIMRFIIHQTDFIELEAAWRGLYFLVRRIETDSTLKIFILDVSKSELINDLKSAANLTESFIYKTLTAEEGNSYDQINPSFLAGNYTFDVDVDDTAALMRLAKISESINAPFVSYLNPESLFGSSGSNLKNDYSLVAESASQLWNVLRSMDEAGFIGLSPISFMGRIPYGEKSEPVESFSFEELDSNHKSQILWINPCFFVTFILAKGFYHNGWNIDSRIFTHAEKFPLHLFETQEGFQTSNLIDFDLTEEKYLQMIEMGLIPLLSFRNSDKIQLPQLPSIAYSKEKLRGKWSV